MSFPARFYQENKKVLKLAPIQRNTTYIFLQNILS